MKIIIAFVSALLVLAGILMMMGILPPEACRKENPKLPEWNPFTQEYDLGVDGLEDEAEAFEPVVHGIPFISQNWVLSVDPCYITKSDAEEIVAVLSEAMIATAVGAGAFPDARDVWMDQGKRIHECLSKWSKRLEEMK